MSTPPPPLVFAQAIAPLLLGSIFASPLYGIALAQGISYYRSYPRDNKFVKCSVGIPPGGIVYNGAHSSLGRIVAVSPELLHPHSLRLELIFYYSLIDSVHMFSLANAVLVWYLRAVPDPQYPPSMIASTFASYVTTALVQSVRKAVGGPLYYRVYLVNVFTSTSDASFAPASGLKGVLVLCQLGGGLGLHIFSHSILGQLIQLRSDAMIDKLIFYFIGISTLSSVFALLNLVTWVAMPNNIIFVIFHSIISKRALSLSGIFSLDLTLQPSVYVNSLLVTLNSRQQFRRNLSNSNGVDTSKEDGVIPLSTFVAEA
ncbi:hypothetical protein EYR40_007432 [Pleurotus pulmonarius]|nr:hypothetical protein EYR38_008267 [Pleurotus pulmonarius]KAF4596982.1 hypothetical protein EYR40_007432 [Pleurotus pulmonarius]